MDLRVWKLYGLLFLPFPRFPGQLELNLMPTCISYWVLLHLLGPFLICLPFYFHSLNLLRISVIYVRDVSVYPQSLSSLVHWALNILDDSLKLCFLAFHGILSVSKYWVLTKCQASLGPFPDSVPLPLLFYKCTVLFPTPGLCHSFCEVLLLGVLSFDLRAIPYLELLESD